jgi:hypothetical protein
MDPNEEWLQKRLAEYRSNGNDMYESIEELDDMDKLGQGFTLADPLEECDTPEFITNSKCSLCIPPQ